jgi:hypothetical protein
MIPLVGFRKELDLQVAIVHETAKKVQAEQKVKLSYQVGTLQLDFLDRDGRLIWRGSGAQLVRRNPGSPQERAAAIHETVAKILTQYPPQRR